jgi:hypothetical protein
MVSQCPIPANALVESAPPHYQEHHLLPDKSPDYDETDGARFREGWVGTPLGARATYFAVAFVIGGSVTMGFWWATESFVVLALGLAASGATAVLVSLGIDDGFRRFKLWWRIYRYRAVQSLFGRT